MVFPTPVGVFLTESFPLPEFPGLPHARGGVSILEKRKWKRVSVFPTPVGVFLDLADICKAVASLPHARGCQHQLKIDPLFV